MSDKNKTLSTYVKKEYKFNRKECFDFPYCCSSDGDSNLFAVSSRTA